MDKLKLSLNEDQTKALLVLIHATSNTDWPTNEIDTAMKGLTEQVRYAVAVQLPHLTSFLSEVDKPAKRHYVK